MNESRKDKKSSMVEQDNLILTVIKTDVNLSRLPFFSLNRRGLKTELVREWIFAETRKHENVELVWRIMATPQYGYPSPFAKKVHRAVEYLLTQNGFPVPEYIVFSFCEIEDILELPHSGKTYKKIYNALESIVTTSIQSIGTYCYLADGGKHSINETFHLYNEVTLVGKELPNGTIADRNRIYFSRWYLKAINSGYIKPLDFPYWNHLNRAIARRLYEYLSIMSFATKCKPYSIEYQRLCELLPITPQRYFSLAERILSPSHKELIKTGFLRKVTWRKSKTDPKKWIIVYYFGPRAKSELQRGFKDDTYRPAILAVETAEITEIEELIESEEEQEVKPKRKRKQAEEEKELSPIAQELINRGITKSVAIDFAYSFPEEYIQEKIDMHDIRKATGEIWTNAAGWLREAITRDYKLSEEQQKKQEQLQKQQAGQEALSKIEAQAREIQEQRLKEALADFPSSEEWVEECVMQSINVREMTIKSIGGEPFSEEEIKELYNRFRTQIPKTDEEKKEWLISSSDKLALSAIIEELDACRDGARTSRWFIRDGLSSRAPRVSSRSTRGEEQQQNQLEESTETANRGDISRRDILTENPANEQVLFNSVGEVLTEIAKQQAEFEVQEEE